MDEKLINNCFCCFLSRSLKTKIFGNINFFYPIFKATLKAWLYEHRKNPYPSKGEKVMLAILTKMTLTQVSTWFANARRRLKKENRLQNKLQKKLKKQQQQNPNELDVSRLTDEDDDEEEEDDEGEDDDENSQRSEDSASQQQHQNKQQSQKRQLDDDDEDNDSDNNNQSVNLSNKKFKNSHCEVEQNLNKPKIWSIADVCRI